MRVVAPEVEVAIEAEKQFVKLKKQGTSFAVVLIVLGGMFLASFLWVRSAQRQYHANRQLIEALKQSDTKTAMALVEAGADPNTREAPSSAPTLLAMINRVLHRSRPSLDASPTAFMMASGKCWVKIAGEPSVLPGCDENLSLLQTMLNHHADVLAASGDHWTAIQGAVELQRWRTVDLLLQHGANANAQDTDGETPLMSACNAMNAKDAVNGAHLLLKHGANPNLRNRVGRTALFFAVVWPPANGAIPDLLASGADPDLPDQSNVSPLQTAKKIGRSDLATLLSKYRKHR